MSTVMPICDLPHFPARRCRSPQSALRIAEGKHRLCDEGGLEVRVHARQDSSAAGIPPRASAPSAVERGSLLKPSVTVSYQGAGRFKESVARSDAAARAPLSAISQRKASTQVARKYPTWKPSRVMLRKD